MKTKVMKTKLTLLEINAIAKKANRLFNRAANAWVRGNNSGNPEMLKRCEMRCDTIRREAEELLAPFKILCDYPGLYPSLTVKGAGHHSVESAISAALE